MNPLPVFNPSPNDYVRRSRPLKHPNGRGIKYDQKIAKYIHKHIHSKSKKEIAKHLGMCRDTIQTLCRYLGYSGRIKKTHYSFLSQRTVKNAIEDYFGKGMQIKEIATKHKISHTTVSQYIKKMLPIRQSDNTIVITKPSKI